MEKKNMFQLGYHVAEKDRHAEAAKQLAQPLPTAEVIEIDYVTRYEAMLKKLMPLFIFSRESDSDKKYVPRFTPMVPIVGEVSGEAQKIGIFFRFDEYQGNITANICLWPEDPNPGNGHIPSFNTENFRPETAELLDKNDRHDWYKCDELEKTIDEYFTALSAMTIEEASELGFPKNYLKNLPSGEDKQLDIEEEVQGILA